MPTERHNVLLLPVTTDRGGFLREYEVPIDESGVIEPIVHDGRTYVFSHSLKDPNERTEVDEPLIFRADD